MGKTEVKNIHDTRESNSSPGESCLVCGTRGPIEITYGYDWAFSTYLGSMQWSRELTSIQNYCEQHNPFPDYKEKGISFVPIRR